MSEIADKHTGFGTAPFFVSFERGGKVVRMEIAHTERELLYIMRKYRAEGIASVFPYGDSGNAPPGPAGRLHKVMCASEGIWYRSARAASAATGDSAYHILLSCATGQPTPSKRVWKEKNK